VSLPQRTLRLPQRVLHPAQRMARRARSVDPRAVYAGLAVVLVAWAVAKPGVLSDHDRTVVVVVMTAAIAWCLRAPVTVLVVELAGIALLPNNLDLPEGIAILIAAYSAAHYSEKRLLVAGLLVATALGLLALGDRAQIPTGAVPLLGVAVLIAAYSAALRGDRRLVVAALLFAATAWLLAFGGQAKIRSGLVPVLLIVPVWLAGSVMRRHQHRAEASAQRAERLEQERDAALRAERARIARELHDVVTHSVSVMVMQTGAAREIMARDERRSRGMLQSVEASGRSALEELRRLLGVLSDQEGDAPLSPQPSVAEIPVLIEQVRRTGQPVELRVEGQPQPVSGGVGVAAYRIVQEALTNVLKHANGAPSEVVLRWDDRALELEIIDEGPPQNGARHDAEPGRGLTGMRERAAMYGGTLDARPGRKGGYVVRAHIPLERQGT
jgi:signal transduction histidine kinase